MKAHELANILLNCPDLEITGSVDISTSDKDSQRTIFTNACVGVNDDTGDNGEIIILFSAIPIDNFGKKF